MHSKKRENNSITGFSEKIAYSVTPTDGISVSFEKAVQLKVKHS